MRLDKLPWRGFLLFLISLLCGVGGYWFVPLVMWEPAFPGVFVALSMLGGAVLVRLARNAPITAPAAFNDEDLKRFFDTLEALARRLFTIFTQVLVTLVIVIVAIAINANAKNAGAALALQVSPFISGIMFGLIVWLLIRLVSMTFGDIGFLRLQRTILEHAIERERSKEIAKRTASPIQFRSPGSFGSTLP